MRHPPHLSYYDGVGQRRHFLSVNTYRRHRHFERKWVVDMALKQILQAARRRAFSIPAYCFMPDHFHALVYGRITGF